jgi:hypothetical protein
MAKVKSVMAVEQNRPWLISRFPTKLRKALVADCVLKGIRISDRLEVLVKKELGIKEH